MKVRHLYFIKTHTLVQDEPANRMLTFSDMFLHFWYSGRQYKGSNAEITHMILFYWQRKAFSIAHVQTNIWPYTNFQFTPEAENILHQ